LGISYQKFRTPLSDYQQKKINIIKVSLKLDTDIITHIAVVEPPAEAAECRLLLHDNNFVIINKFKV